MWFPTWPRSRDGRPAIERLHPSQSPRRRPRFRPGTEVLDARLLLSTLTVTSNYDNPYASPGDGTLRGEIAAAQSGDTIVFAPTLNGQTIALNPSPGFGSQLEINQNLTIQGPGAGLLAIYGNYHTRVFRVDAGANVAISGLTIEGGDGDAILDNLPGGGNPPDYYDGHGGGVLNLGTLTLSACTVAGNDTGTVSGSIDGHAFFTGGGIENLGTMTLSGCTVTGNYNRFEPTPQYGGGIYNNGTLTLSGCTVTNNSAAWGGGGIFNETQGHLTILSSVVKNNTARDGNDICDLGWMQISKDSKVGQVSYK